MNVQPNKPRGWPRLSQSLHKVTDLQTCQNCLRTLDVERWREHDDNDKPEQVFVHLCKRCSGKIIAPHPRLYELVDKWAPVPGLMGLCESCDYRKGLQCTHRDARANGGTGVVITFPRPITTHVNRGRGRSGFMAIYEGPPRACSGKTDSATVHG